MKVVSYLYVTIPFMIVGTLRTGSVVLVRVGVKDPYDLVVVVYPSDWLFLKPISR